MTNAARPLKPTAANVTQVLKAAGVAPNGMQRAGLHAAGTDPVIVDYYRPLGARHATTEQIDGWFTTAAEALAARGLTLDHTLGRKIGFVTAA
jgi:hypothetical protein